MKTSVINYLACPVCKGSFKNNFTESDIDEGQLVCSGCGRDYPVIRGIPRLLPDSLITYLQKQIPEDFAKFNFSFPLDKRSQKDSFETPGFIENQKNTMDAFSFEWNKFTEFNPDFTKDEYVRTLSPLKPDIVKDKVVLEAGTGAGIFLDWFNHYGAKHVFGLNLGLDVETAAKRAAKFDNITIVEGDIFHLPFKPTIDFVISHGVVHHLPDPEGGFKNLVSVLKPKGEVFIWVYGNDLVVPIIEFLRKTLIKLPKPLTKKICWSLALPLLASKIVYLTFKAIPGLNKLADKVPYKQYAVRNYSEMHCTIMDKLFVPVVNYYDKPELQKWFDRENLENISIENRDGNSWSCYGIKKSN